MRRTVVFVALVAPVAIWFGLAAWAQSRGARWAPEQGELGFVTLVAIASSQWAVRIFPFVAIPASLLWPITVPGLAALTRDRSGEGATHQDVLRWWVISVGAGVCMALTGGLLYFRGGGVEAVPLLGALAWPCAVALWLSFAAAYTLLQSRYRGDKSRWTSREVLGGLAVLNCFGLSVLPPLVAIAFRRGEKAVEQRHEPDAG